MSRVDLSSAGLFCDPYIGATSLEGGKSSQAESRRISKYIGFFQVGSCDSNVVTALTHLDFELVPFGPGAARLAGNGGSTSVSCIRGCQCHLHILP